MRKIKEVLRLKLDCGISEREISRSCSISRSTVADYLRRAAAAKLTWAEASALAETQLEERLFPTEHVPSSVKRPPPDCEYIYNQLRTYQKFNLTLPQLWLEYKEKHPDGYQYTQFCEHYWRWRKKLDYCMRQELPQSSGRPAISNHPLYDSLQSHLVPSVVGQDFWSKVVKIVDHALGFLSGVVSIYGELTKAAQERSGFGITANNWQDEPA